MKYGLRSWRKLREERIYFCRKGKKAEKEEKLLIIRTDSRRSICERARERARARESARARSGFFSQGRGNNMREKARVGDDWVAVGRFGWVWIGD